MLVPLKKKKKLELAKNAKGKCDSIKPSQRSCTKYLISSGKLLVATVQVSDGVPTAGNPQITCSKVKLLIYNRPKKDIKELTNRRLSHDDAVRLRDVTSAHAYVGTCQSRAKVDDVGQGDLQLSRKYQDSGLVAKVF